MSAEAEAMPSEAAPEKYLAPCGERQQVRPSAEARPGKARGRRQQREVGVRRRSGVRSGKRCSKHRRGLQHRSTWHDALGKIDVRQQAMQRPRLAVAQPWDPFMVVPHDD
eukprot:CAMPEP_0183423668 /NCGR_PEP_ID=MMETSP0370-20130417/28645_1 /TAXON_ID=268820 /ORGANISM="Peridinium aciculiferum, Strain PAER-2" /LENGTH=109 /DNA_ID=CAMNT_0025607881 /DNA_START=60 /DNA_END=387 /DNA_ORIENTATION=-